MAKEKYYWIEEYKRIGRLKKTEYRRHRFPRKYTPSEVGLLARTDELHRWLSEPATKNIVERECVVLVRGSTAWK